MAMNRTAAGLRANLLLGASVGALLISVPAYAQTTAQPVDPAGTPTGKAKAQQAPPTNDQQQALQSPPADATVGSSGADTATGNQNQIVVTGTRIRQPEFTSPDPVARIDPQIAQREGKLSTADTLQSSPIASGSTQITSAISSNFVTNGGPGAQTIDLRGLGANRTLVLLNGRRAGPAGTRGAVSSFDLNVLPQAIVKQVDILKTGASSIYGSDAIAGVVNLITKTDFDGIQVDGFGNVPFRSGGEEFSGSVLWGKTFDRGHVMVALDYYHQNEMARGDRSYLGCPAAYIFQPNSDQRADLIDPRSGKYHCEDLRWGHLWTYDLERRFHIGPGNLFTTAGAYAGGLGTVSLLQFQYPGETLGIPPIDPNAGIVGPFRSPPGWFPTGYDGPSTAVQNAYHPFVLEQSLIPKTSRYTVYGDASYELTDNIEAYAEFLGNRRKTYQNGWRQIWTFGYTGDIYDDPNDPYGTYWAQGFSGFNWLSPTGITNHADTSQKVDYWRGVGGLRGDLGGLLKGWSYDAYVQYSHNKGLYKTEQFLQEIYDVSYFQTASCVGTTLPFSGKQCIDLPWTDPNFLAGNFTPEQADFMFDWETGKTTYKQLSGEASLTGNLFDLPAGAVGVALGVAARRDEIKDTPGSITFSPNPYFDPSLAIDDDQCQPGGNRPLYPCEPFHNNAWGASGSGITAGHANTSELFGEIQVPLLKERPMFRDLSFSGAARVTTVKSVRSDGFTDKDSGNWTYKLGGNWAVNNWLRFRGTYGTSFRSPALFEQFQAAETSFASQRAIDPCINVDQNEAIGAISARIAANCRSQGIPGDFPGGSITASVLSQGGIGELDPETSKALTASIILTPTFSFLPKTRLSLAVDYFDIKVKGEVTKLGAQNILFQCYNSDFFPDDPLCSLFQRGTAVDPFTVTTVHDQYINIASQENKGLDFTALIQHNLGSLGTLTLLGNATYQLKDTQALFEDTTQDLNGRVGDPKFVADINATLRTRTGWSFFWGTEIYGKASNNKIFTDQNGTLCPTSIVYGNYCVHVSVPATWYHAASVTKEFGPPKNRLEVTFGMRNIFDTKPPKVTTLNLGGIPALIGPVVGTSQYDLIGRRIFLNFSKKF